jgi:hypothetical protein
MFRSIQGRFSKRLENLKQKTNSQGDLERVVRSFLIKEFGSIGETLSFKASHENRKLYLKFENKTAANEVVLRTHVLKEALQAYKSKIETIQVS